MLVLHAEPGLERVVVAVGDIFCLGDAAKPLIYPVEI